MTRPVRGYLTKEGQFFSTKAEADLYEASKDFHDALHDHLDAAGLSGTVLDFIIDKTREFVLINNQAVKRYLTLNKTVPEASGDDIRSVLLQPATAPVDEPIGLEVIPMEELEVDDEFVSAFTDTMGSDDTEGTEAGGNPVGGLDGEEAESDSE